MSLEAKGILLVEDSRIQAKIIRTQFETLTEFSVYTAHSMNEAQSQIKDNKHNIFAAVVDLNLPDAPHGEIADLCQRNAIPSVVLTASFDEALRTKFMQTKVADYFFKGTIEDMDPLIASVQRLYANGRVKALVVDDSLVLRNIIKGLLEVQCIESLDAKDGVEALEVLSEHPDIQLVVTDFQMPRMDGIELVRQIRATHKAHRMAIIGVSSAGSGPLTAQFLKNGANDFITKPFEAEEFYWRINQMLTVLDMMDEVREYRKKTGLG